MPLTLGQAWTPTPVTSGVTSKSITGPTTSVIGRQIVVTVCWQVNGITISSISDNAGNIYTLQGSSFAGDSGRVSVSIYTAPVSTNVTLTITVNFSGSANNAFMSGVEVNNWNGTLLVDPLSLVQDNQGAWITDEITTAVYSNSTFFGAVYSDGNTGVRIGSGFNSRGITSAGQGVFDTLGLNYPQGPYDLVPFTSPIQTGKTAIVIFAILAVDSAAPTAIPPRAIGTNPVAQYARGVFSLSNVDDSNLAANPGWSQANISGVVCRFSWANLEQSYRQFNWAPVDAALALANANSRYISLFVATNPNNNHQPAWLGALGCSTYTYWDSHNTTAITGYAPWDPIFLAELQYFVAALGARYGNDAHIGYVSVGTGCGDSEAYITKGTNGLAQLNALGGPQIWVNSTIQTVGYFIAAFPKTQIIFIVGNPVPNDTTIMPGLLANLNNQYVSQFGFASHGLTGSKAPSDFFTQYVGMGHPLGFQPATTGDPGGSAIAALLSNGYLLGGNVQALGGQFFEMYAVQVTDGGAALLYNLYAQLLFGAHPPIIPPPWPVPPQIPGPVPIDNTPINQAGTFYLRILLQALFTQGLRVVRDINGNMYGIAAVLYSRNDVLLNSIVYWDPNAKRITYVGAFDTSPTTLNYAPVINKFVLQPPAGPLSVVVPPAPAGGISPNNEQYQGGVAAYLYDVVSPV